MEITDTQPQRTQVIRQSVRILDKHSGKQLGECNAERGTSHISLKFLISEILECDPNHCTLLAEDGTSYHAEVGPETKMIYATVTQKKIAGLQARSRSPARGQSHTNPAYQKLADQEENRDEDNAQEPANHPSNDAHTSDSDFLMGDLESIPPKPAQQEQTIDTSTDAGTDSVAGQLPMEEPSEDPKQQDEDHALSQTACHQINPHEEISDKEKRATRIMAEPAGHFKQRIRPCPPDRQPGNGRGTSKPQHQGSTLGGTAARPKRSTSQPPIGGTEAKRGK